MKRVNTLSRILMLCFGIMLTFGAAAQGGQGGQRPSMEERQAQTLKTYKEQLKLTDEQVTKLEVINKRSFESMQALRGQNQDLSREERMAKRLEIQKKTDEEIKAILTEEQKPLYDQLLAQREERMRQFGQGGQGGQAGQGQRQRNNN